jgi:hypothetical protein
MIMRRAYLDACVALYYVEQHQTLFQRVDSALFPASGEQIIPVFSDLTRMECRVLPLRNHDQALLARYEAFFQLPDCDSAHLYTIVFDLSSDGIARPIRFEDTRRPSPSCCYAFRVSGVLDQ